MNNETIRAITSMIVIIAVNVANMVGFSLDADALTQTLLCVFAMVTLIYGIWKNHNFTSAAQDAQSILDTLKDGKGYGLGDDNNGL